MPLPQGMFLPLVSPEAHWGEERVLSIAPPSAGEGFSISIDPRWYVIVRMLRFTLETNAEAGERILTYELERNNKTVWSAHIEPAVAAEKKQTYNLIAGDTPSLGASAASDTIAVIPLVLMHPADKMVFAWSGIKATDKVVGLTMVQERFDFEGNPNTRYTQAMRELIGALHKELNHGAE